MSIRDQATPLAADSDPGLRVIQFIEKFDAALIAAGYTHADRMTIVGLLWDSSQNKTSAPARHKFTPDEMYFMLTVYKNPGTALQIPLNNQWAQPEALGMVDVAGPLAWRPTAKLDEMVVAAFGFASVSTGACQ